MAYEFHYRRLVHWVDTDVGGIIHFSNYFRYMEETETEFYRSLGLYGVGKAPDSQAFSPRVSASCDFKKTVTFGDELDIHLWVRHKGRSSIGYGFAFHCGEDEVARGQLTVVCVEKGESGRVKPVPIPKHLDEALQVAPFANEKNKPAAT